MIVLNCVPLCLNNEFFHKRHARDLIAKTKKGFQPPSARFYLFFFYLAHARERDKETKETEGGDRERGVGNRQAETEKQIGENLWNILE